MERIDRRTFLARAAAGMAGGALLGAAPARGLAAALPGSAAGRPRPGSPRHRLLTTDTSDTLRLFAYYFDGMIGPGHAYTVPMLRTLADIYEMGLWITPSTGVIEVLHEARADFIATPYMDMTWNGYENQGNDNLPWLPIPFSQLNSHESFFSHNALSPYPHKRLEGPFYGDQEFLMNPLDFDPANPPRRDRWINFYGNTALDLVRQSGGDGFFSDEAMYSFATLQPDGYSLPAWHDAIKAGLGFTRSLLGPDRILAWNGLQFDPVYAPEATFLDGPRGPMPNTIDYFDHCDAALLEEFVTTFATDQGQPGTTGTVHTRTNPEVEWEYDCNLAMAITARDKVLLAQAARDPDIADSRMLAMTSFYLVKGRRSYFSHGDALEVRFFYPEWGIRLGRPTMTGEAIRDYLVRSGDSVGLGTAAGIAYARPYERGFAIANPSLHPTVVSLARPMYLAAPWGGGTIGRDGSIPHGDVSYSKVSSFTIPPQGGAVVLFEPQAPGTHLPQRPGFGRTRGVTVAPPAPRRKPAHVHRRRHRRHVARHHHRHHRRPRDPR